MNKLPLPRDCTFTHYSSLSNAAHYCHVQWVEPDDPVPWNAAVEWFGSLDDLDIPTLEQQGFLKLLEFIRVERAKDEPQS